MRTKSLSLAVALLAVSVLGSGCIAIAKGNRLGRTERQAVYVDGRLYVVDVCSGKVMLMDADCIAKAKPFVPSNDGDCPVRDKDD